MLFLTRCGSCACLFCVLPGLRHSQKCTFRCACRQPLQLPTQRCCRAREKINSDLPVRPAAWCYRDSLSSAAERTLRFILSCWMWMQLVPCVRSLSAPCRWLGPAMHLARSISGTFRDNKTSACILSMLRTGPGGCGTAGPQQAERMPPAPGSFGNGPSSSGSTGSHEGHGRLRTGVGHSKGQRCGCQQRGRSAMVFASVSGGVSAECPRKLRSWIGLTTESLHYHGCLS